MSSSYFLSVLFLLAFWIIASFPNESAGTLARPGCNDTCGNVRIPYPFGIGSNCAVNRSYTVACTSSKPYLTQLNLEVLNVSLGNQTVTVNVPLNPSCTSRPQPGAVTSWDSTNLVGTPYFFSKFYNKMMLLGCGNAVLSGSQRESKILTGCTSTCEFNTSKVISSCYGVFCCEAAIPFFLTRYKLNISVSRLNTQNCSSAFLADKNWLLPAGNLDSELSSSNVPVVLAWTLGKNDVRAIYPCAYEMTYLDTDSGDRVETYRCSTCEMGAADTESVNPYLQQQCGIVREPHRNNNTKAALIGAFSGLGSLLLIATIFTLYKLVKRKKDRMMKDKCFKRNGGLLLQQQLSADEGIVEKTRIFTSSELDKASDGFNPNLILGQGGQGTVYKGMLTDGRLIAIKKSKKVDESQLEQFINEVVILSQVNHRNVVKLLGCCLETEVPILVYELIPNGTLFSLIHNKNDGDDDQFPFTWKLRLRIATEVAGALAYLHSATSMPIYHRDIKSSNILLDEKYIAKVSDFGTSRSIAIDKTHFTTKVKGTFGYLDPEYFQSSQFTEKSDVYSFGVVLVELLTRKRPISLSEAEEDSHLSLATKFLKSMDEDRLRNIVDPHVLDEGNEDEVVAMAKLAKRCLNLNGKKRPTMKEVAIELESIKLSATRSTVEENFQIQGSSNEGEYESVMFTDVIPSWASETVSFEIESSGSYPLLRDTI